MSTEQRWWVVLARAEGLVLLFHVLPMAGAVYSYSTPTDPAVAPLILVIIIVVAASLGVDLLLAAVLVAAGMRNVGRVGLIAGGTGILLTAYTLVTAANELVVDVRR